MQHLKLFEKFEEEELYHTLSHSEYLDGMGDKNLGDEDRYFGINSKNEMRRTLESLGATHLYFRSGRKLSDGFFSFVGFRLFNYEFEYFLTFDEWIILKSIDTSAVGNKRYKYYKCDSFDGVIKVLEDLKIKLEKK